MDPMAAGSKEDKLGTRRATHNEVERRHVIGRFHHAV